MMKNFIFLIAILVTVLLPVTTSAQTSDDIFKEYSKADNAYCVNINSSMLRISKWLMGNDPETAIIKNMKSMRILDLDECSDSVKDKFSDSISALSSNGYEELIAVNDDGEEVKVLAKIKNDRIKQLLIANSEDSMLVEINGNFTMDQISALVSMGH